MLQGLLVGTGSEAQFLLARIFLSLSWNVKVHVKIVFTDEIVTGRSSGSHVCEGSKVEMSRSGNCAI